MEEENKNKYHFVAVTPEGKKVSGTLTAQDETKAKEVLSERGLALFSLELYAGQSEDLTVGFKSFEFEGVDADDKTVRGTIEAENGYQAYKKLHLEYEFVVSLIIPAEANEEERAAIHAAGIPEDWGPRFIEDKKKFDRLNKDKKKRKKEEDPLLSEKDRRELQVYQEEIGEITRQVLEMLQKNEEYLDVSAKREIMDRIGLLSRLRRSNAIDHLRSLTDKLLKQLNDDKLFIEAEKLSVEQQAELETRRQEFGAASESLSKSITSGLSAVAEGLAAINPEDVKQQIIDADPLRKLFQTFYLVIVSLLGLFMIYWVVNSVKLIIDTYDNATLFSFSSPILWLLTGISLILSFSLAPLFFARGEVKLEKKLLFAGVSLFAVLFFIWLSPVLFWWTR